MHEGLRAFQNDANLAHIGLHLTRWPYATPGDGYSGTTNGVRSCLLPPPLSHADGDRTTDRAVGAESQPRDCEAGGKKKNLTPKDKRAKTTTRHYSVATCPSI